MFKDFTCDTDKLISDADEIINYASTFEQDIYDFYKKLEFMSYEQAIWSGKGANAYYQLALKEKKQYDEYGEGIKDIAKELKEFATNLDDKINKNEKICESDDNDLEFY
ncbi:MAG: hypothetical protein K5666_01055 [Bacilli bacterium]|nr:hypothetical protein [Bacilli bacterium]